MSSHRFLCAAALLLCSTPAWAQVDRPPPDPPPGAVSQLNGIPVKIGERNEYIYTYRPWNVSANPIGWVLGIYGASLSYGFHPNAAFRADVTYYNPVDSGYSALEVSAGVPLYFRRVYQGIYLEPGLVVRSSEDSGGGEGRVFGPQVLAGWHWSWDSGFNVSAAFGFGRNLSSEETEFDDGEEIFVNGYLRFGYAF